MMVEFMLISGCVLVKNECEILSGCLESLSAIADEIIIVDNGSTDDIHTVANKFKCRIVSSNDTELDEGRNLYLKMAKHPWVLVLDADERILAKEGTLIRDAVNKAPDSTFGFYLPRLEYTGEGRWSQIMLLRLFRNRPEIFYNNSSIHASPLRSIIRSGGVTSRVYAAIHHFDLLVKDNPTIKRQRYVKLLRKEILKKKAPEDLFSLYCYLGIEYGAIGELDQAEFYYNKAINLNLKPFAFPRIHLAQNYLLKGELKAVEYEADLICALNDGFKERALILKAEVAYRQNRILDAKAYIMEALVCSPFAPHLYLNLAALLEETNPLQAIEYINQAISINPLLLDKSVYIKCDGVNIFCQQISLLSCVKNIYKHMGQCLMNLYRNTEGLRWLQLAKDFEMSSAL